MGSYTTQSLSSQKLNLGVRIIRLDETSRMHLFTKNGKRILTNIERTQFTYKPFFGTTFKCFL